MPVYNVAAYIRDALTSALDQDCDFDYEVLLIDDASPDDSMTVARDVMRQHRHGDRVRIITHAHNLGLGEARNTAIREAQGRYLFFLDSDDCISTDCLRVLGQLAVEHHAQVVAGSTMQMRGEERTLRYPLLDAVYDHEAAGVWMYVNDRFMNIESWNKLYDLDWLHGRQICTTTRIMEDSVYDFRVRAEAHDVVTSSHVTYFYRLRDDSILGCIFGHAADDSTLAVYYDIITQTQTLITQRYAGVSGIYDLYCLRLFYSLYSIRKMQLTAAQQALLSRNFKSALHYIPHLSTLSMGLSRWATFASRLRCSDWQTYLQIFDHRSWRRNVYLSRLFRWFCLLLLVLNVAVGYAQTTAVDDRQVQTPDVAVGNAQTSEVADTALFSNPVISPDWPDPTIWLADDSCYYSLSTAGLTQCRAMRSRDLIKWYVLNVPIWDDQTDRTLHLFGRNLWAPQVTKVNDQWRLYLTCITNAPHSYIVVLKPDTTQIEGLDSLQMKRIGGLLRWQYHNQLVASVYTGIKDCIDPYVLTDAATGRVWLFFGSTGGIYRIELNSDGTDLAEGAQAVHVAGLDIRNCTSRSQVFEGSYVLQHDGFWYLIVSSGDYRNHTYALRVGRSETVDGLYVDRQGRLMTEGYSELLLSSAPSDKFYGPGHNGEIFTDLDGRTYIFYHSHSRDINRPMGNYMPRPMMLQQLFWDDEGWPFLKDGKPQATDIMPRLH